MHERDSNSDDSSCDASDDSIAEDFEFPPFVTPVNNPRVGLGNTGSSADDVLNQASRKDAADDPDLTRSRLVPRSPMLKELGQWKILREVGRGGMGVVFAAMHKQLGEHVALKFLPVTAGMDSRRIERFRHEALVIERLNHPNIVRLHSLQHIDGHHFLVMQLIDGISLDRVVGSITHHRTSAFGAIITDAQHRNVSDDSDTCKEHQWLNEKLFGPGKDRFLYIAGLIQKTAQALSYAHSQRVIHRDIKPSNVLVNHDDDVWITDFGLAQIQGEHNLTATGDLLGTLRYMSPEQAMASRIPIDHRTDIYSLGATLYELLSGVPAFRSDDRRELLQQVLFDDPIPLNRIDDSIPTPLQIIVEKAMRKDPRHRYSTAGEMADDLFRFLSNTPIRALRASRFEPVFRWCRRNAALTVSVLIVAILLITLMMGRFIHSELESRHRTTLQLLQRTESAEEESRAFAVMRKVARYRQAGLTGLRSQMKQLMMETQKLSDDAKSELRNEWLSCLIRPDWSFDQSIDCASDIVALSPSGELIAEVLPDSNGQVVQIRNVTSAGPAVKTAPLWLQVRALWFSRGNEFLITTDLAQNWQIVRTADGRHMFEIPQNSLGCDLCDTTKQAVFWNSLPTLHTASLTGDLPTPALRTISLKAPASLVRFSPDGTRLAVLESSASSRLTVVDVEGNVIWTRAADRAITLDWSDDGQFLALPNQSRSIEILNADSAHVVSRLTGLNDVISTIDWHPSGNYLLTAAWNGETLLRHTWTDRVLIRSQDKLDAIGFSGNGNRIGWAAKPTQSGGYKLSIADWQPGAVVELPWYSENGSLIPSGVCFHPDGRLMVVCSLYELQVFDLFESRRLARIPLDGTLDAEFSADGGDLIVLTRTGISHWPVKKSENDDQHFFEIGPPQIVSIPVCLTGVLTDNGTSAVVRTSLVPDQLTRINSSSGKVEEPSGTVQPGLDVEAIGPFLVRRGWREQIAEIHDRGTLKTLATLNVGTAAVQSASPDGQYLTSSTLENLEAWNTMTWTSRGQLSLDAPVVSARAEFHPSEQLAVVRLMNSRLGLFDPGALKVVARIDELEDHWLSDFRFSPDGKHLAELSSQPGSVRVWKFNVLNGLLVEQKLHWDTTRNSLEASQEDLSDAGLRSASPLYVKLIDGNATPKTWLQQIEIARDQMTTASSNPRMLNLLAWDLLTAPEEMRKNSEALDLSRRCNLLAPDYPPYRNTLGLACFRNGLYAEAEQLLMKNLETSTPAELTTDLIILAMIAHQEGKASARDAFKIWAEQQMLNHPPLTEMALNEVRTLMQELQKQTAP